MEIKYEITEVFGGFYRRRYTPKCPFGISSKETGSVISVGSLDCEYCENCLGNYIYNQTVTCKYGQGD